MEGKAVMRESWGEWCLSMSQTEDGHSGSRRKWTRYAVGGLQGGGKVVGSLEWEEVLVGIGISQNSHG